MPGQEDYGTEEDWMGTLNFRNSLWPLKRLLSKLLKMVRWPRTSLFLYKIPGSQPEKLGEALKSFWKMLTKLWKGWWVAEMGVFDHFDANIWRYLLLGEIKFVFLLWVFLHFSFFIIFDIFIF
jgi:hypothetical protein